MCKNNREKQSMADSCTHGSGRYLETACANDKQHSAVHVSTSDESKQASSHITQNPAINGVTGRVGIDCGFTSSFPKRSDSYRSEKSRNCVNQSQSHFLMSANGNINAANGGSRFGGNYYSNNCPQKPLMRSGPVRNDLNTRNNKTGFNNRVNDREKQMGQMTPMTSMKPKTNTFGMTMTMSPDQYECQENENWNANSSITSKAMTKKKNDKLNDILGKLARGEFNFNLIPEQNRRIAQQILEYEEKNEQLQENENQKMHNDYINTNDNFNNKDINNNMNRNNNNPNTRKEMFAMMRWARSGMGTHMTAGTLGTVATTDNFVSNGLGNGRRAIINSVLKRGIGNHSTCNNNNNNNNNNNGNANEYNYQHVQSRMFYCLILFELDLYKYYIIYLNKYTHTHTHTHTHTK